MRRKDLHLRQPVPSAVGPAGSVPQTVRAFPNPFAGNTTLQLVVKIR